MSITIGIFGAKGRMGQQLCGLAKEDKEISSFVEYSRGNCLNTFLSQADVVIDFSSPTGTKELLKNAASHKKTLVIGTTGLDEETKNLIASLSLQQAILYSANFSLGIAACLAIIKPLGDMLSDHFSLKITETHHVHKKDSPSGTALALAQASGRKPLIKSLREAEVIGEHHMLFSSDEETLELTHKALSRSTFAKGALFAAKQMHAKPPGLYSLKDLFLSN